MNVVGKLGAVAALALSLGFPSSTGSAVTLTDQFNVQITINAFCQFVGATAPDIDFGTHNTLNASPTDQPSAFKVQCNNALPYRIGLNAGNGVGATTTTRKMTGPGSATINYQLFQDAARTTNWGNDLAGGTDTVNGTGDGLAAGQSYTIHAHVPIQTTPAAGTYTDTVTLTVQY